MLGLFFQVKQAMSNIFTIQKAAIFSLLALFTASAFAVSTPKTPVAASVTAKPSTPAFQRPSSPPDRKAMIDLNRATRDELKTLPGIGDAEANRIIAARPLGSKGWLVSKKLLTEDQALAIRHRVYVGGPHKAPVTKKARPSSAAKT